MSKKSIKGVSGDNFVIDSEGNEILVKDLKPGITIKGMTSDGKPAPITIKACKAAGEVSGNLSIQGLICTRKQLVVDSVKKATVSAEDVESVILLNQSNKLVTVICAPLSIEEKISMYEIEADGAFFVNRVLCS